MPFIGAIEYHIVSDGVAWSDGGGAFGLVPKIIWEKKISPDPYNRIPLNLDCLLVKAGGKNILVDTGVGSKLNAKQIKIMGIERPTGNLLEQLAQHNLGPADIDIVINTHLHSDHCGGNTYHDPNADKIIPTFPNAQYWVQRLEWADAITPNERTQATYFPENYRILEETGQLKLVSGDVAVAAGVNLVVTRGHTRGHQSVLLESEGEYGLCVADMASLSYHFERTAWVTAYDVEPLETIETKRRWQEWAVKEQATIIFEHDPVIKTGLLQKEGRHYKLEPVLTLT